MSRKHIITRRANDETQGYHAATESWVPCPQATVFPSAREAISVAPQEPGVCVELLDDPGGPKWRWIDGDWVSGVHKFSEV